MQFILDTLGKVGFEWRMALFNFINFLVVFWILKRYAFKPIMKTINDRQERAKAAVDDYKQAKSELQMAEKKAQEIIDEAKGEASKIVAQSHDEAEAVALDMRDKAKAEIELLVKQAKKNIAIDREEMQQEIRKEAAALVVLSLQKVLGEKLDKTADEAYVRGIVSSIK